MSDWKWWLRHFRLKSPWNGDSSTRSVLLVYSLIYLSHPMFKTSQSIVLSSVVSDEVPDSLTFYGRSLALWRDVYYGNFEQSGWLYHPVEDEHA